MDGGNDPDNRRMIEFNSNDVLINYLSKLGKLRQDLSSLTRGNMELLYEEEGMAVFKRTYQAETVFVAINNTSESQKVVLTEGLEKGKELIGLLNGGNFKSDGKQYSIELKSGQSEIYELRNRGGITWIYIAGSIVILFAVSLYVWIKKRKKQNVN